MAEIWDRRSDELERAWQAFLTYRDLGPERSVPKAFRQQSGNHLAKQAGGQWNVWSSRFDWKARVLAWDRHNARVAQAALDKITENQVAKWARRRDQQTEADYAFAQRYAGEIARHFKDKENGPPLAIRDLKDAVAVTAAASALAWVAINAQLPDPDADIDFKAATTDELRAILARVEGKFAPRIARTG